MKGAPLRFAAAVVGGWVVGRVVVLLPAAAPPIQPGLAEREAFVVERIATVEPLLGPANATGHAAWRARPAGKKVTEAVALPSTAPAAAASVEPARPAAADPPSPPEPMPIERVPPLPPPVPPSRLSIDLWLVARPGGGDDLAFGQLGASQGGARLTYPLDRGLALSGRVSAPLRGTAREIGVGVDLKPTRLPIHLLVEQRIDLDGSAIRPAVVAIAGGSVALPWRVRIDAYAQAGGVRRRGGFVDAATIVSRPLVTRGKTRFELGGGAWGAAQRGAARIDAGPSIALVTPGAGGTLRLQLDYRVRLAGRARPGSGPALTLGGSF